MPKSLESNCSQRFTCSKKNVHNHIEEYTYVYEFCAADLNRDARMTALKYAHIQFFLCFDLPPPLAQHEAK
jgi:hypothetical protein